MDRDAWLKIRNTPRKDPRPKKYFHISRQIVEAEMPDGTKVRGCWSIGSYSKDTPQTPAQQGLRDTPNGQA